MENNIIKNLQDKVSFYKEEIQKIETAIEVILSNSDSRDLRKTGSGSESEKSTRGRKEKASTELTAQSRNTSKTSSKKLHPSSKKPISKQVLEYLTETSRFQYPNDIIQTLASRTGKKPEAVRLLVNQTLSRLKKENKLVSVKSENSRSHVWGYENWLASENNPHAEFAAVKESAE